MCAEPITAHVCGANEGQAVPASLHVKVKKAGVEILDASRDSQQRGGGERRLYSITREPISPMTFPVLYDHWSVSH
jgi:hypothetical protein